MARLSHNFGHRFAAFDFVGDEGTTGDMGGHKLPDGCRLLEDCACLLIFPGHDAIEGTTDGATKEVKELVVVASVHVVGWCVVVVALKDFVYHVPINGTSL